MTQLFNQSAESPERTARIWQVIVCLVAFVVGVAGSYSGLFRTGVHSGVGLGFLASATVLGGAGTVLGLLMRGSPSTSYVGSTISGAALCLLLGAWIPVVMIIVRFV